ncbi:MAG: 16S rRNA (cytidine(1402)-2'-O)-methyltransferase [Oleiphilus sp.]
MATPIGNLSDITLRAIEILKSVDLIAAEDTRHTRKLLDHLGISAKLISFHEHNEEDKSGFLVSEVQSGKTVALVSDAGTPLISDPGHTLVSTAKAQGVKVVPIPGASAVIAALSASGVPCGKFVYEGFLPVKRKAKEDVLSIYQFETKTVVFYESPHRVVETLRVMAEIFPDRMMVIARELTKRFETITSGLVPSLLDWTIQDPDQQKGEFVLILAGAEKRIADDIVKQEKLLKQLVGHMPPKKAVQIVNEFYGGDKKELYAKAVSLRNETS